MTFQFSMKYTMLKIGMMSNISVFRTFLWPMLPNSKITFEQNQQVPPVPVNIIQESGTNTNPIVLNRQNIYWPDNGFGHGSFILTSIK